MGSSRDVLSERPIDREAVHPLDTVDPAKNSRSRIFNLFLDTVVWGA